MSDAALTSRAAPRALFLHGAGAWGGQWAIWRRVLEAEGWQVDAPDLQPADDGIAATRLDDYVAQAVGMIEAAPVDVLIGASLGGLIAVAATARIAPETRPQALVLVNPLPPSPWAAELSPPDALTDVVPWRLQGRFASTRRAMSGMSFADQQLAFRHWRDESAAVLREAHAGIVLRGPRIDTLIIASDADEDIPPSVSAAYANGIGASLLRVPGDHLAPVMGVSAAASAQAAARWLAGRLSSR